MMPNVRAKPSCPLCSSKRPRAWRKRCPPGPMCWLDIKGRSIDSPGLAKLLTTLEVKGVRDLAVLIGGPFGLAQELLDRADTRLSLSRLTFTHEMARLICLEQLYRACTIRAGEPYHH